MASKRKGPKMDAAVAMEPSGPLSARSERVWSLINRFDPFARADVQPRGEARSMAFIVESVKDELAQLIWQELPRLKARRVQVFGIFARRGADKHTKAQMATFEQMFGAGSAQSSLAKFKPARAKTAVELVILGHEAVWQGGPVLTPDPDHAGAVTKRSALVIQHWNAFHMTRAVGIDLGPLRIENSASRVLGGLIAPVRSLVGS